MSRLIDCLDRHDHNSIDGLLNTISKQIRITEEMETTQNFVWVKKKKKTHVNPCPAEPGYYLSLQTVEIQISWLLQKPTDLDLHCLPLSI